MDTGIFESGSKNLVFDVVQRGQAAADTDFELEVKFESALTETFQMQGIIVEQDNDNYLPPLSPEPGRMMFPADALYPKYIGNTTYWTATP